MFMRKKINRNIFFFCLVSILTVCSCTQKNKFVINGKLEKTSGGYVYLAEMNLAESNIIDSAKIDKKGKFRFKENSKSPGFYQLLLDQDNFVILLIEPGQSIKFHADADDLSNNYSVEGSEGSVQVKYLTDHLSITRSKLDSIANEINKSYNKKGFDTIYKRLNTKYVQIIKDQRKFTINYIIDHLSSLSSIIALYQQLNDSTYVLYQNKDIQFINLVSDTLKKYYPDCEAVQVLWNDRIRLNKNFDLLQLNYIGSIAKKISYPDIALPDTVGDSIHLSKVKARSLLVFFWNSENEDCRVAVQSIKDIYAEFSRKGLKLYNVAFSEDKKGWKKYINDNKIPGINVLETNISNSYCAQIYNVNSLPATYLIGPDKEIAGKNLFGENLRNKLKEILK